MNHGVSSCCQSTAQTDNRYRVDGGVGSREQSVVASVERQMETNGARSVGDTCEVSRRIAPLARSPEGHRGSA